MFGAVSFKTDCIFLFDLNCIIHSKFGGRCIGVELFIPYRILIHLFIVHSEFYN